jgi:hypothetical protein
MFHAHLTAAVRQLVAATFADLGIDAAAELRETILIRGGIYCGRRFEAESAHAVWFVEENQVKFYRDDGSVALVLEPAETPAEKMLIAA